MKIQIGTLIKFNDDYGIVIDTDREPEQESGAFTIQAPMLWVRIHWAECNRATWEEWETNEGCFEVIG